jgi:Fe-S-cluster-containing dehydrogenase component
VVKCDYCMDRIDAGLKPACVSKCVTHCLEFGKMEEVQRDRRDKIAQTVAFELETVVSAR